MIDLLRDNKSISQQAGLNYKEHAKELRHFLEYELDYEIKTKDVKRALKYLVHNQENMSNRNVRNLTRVLLSAYVEKILDNVFKEDDKYRKSLFHDFPPKYRGRVPE